MLHALSGGRGCGGAGLPQDASAAGVSAGRTDGCDDCVSDGDVGQCVGLSAEYRGAPAVLVACVYYSGLRMDDFVCRFFGLFRDAGAEWFAAALPSVVQRR